jgi:ribonuclease R
VAADPLEEGIRKALRTSPTGPLKAKELARLLEIPTSDYRVFRELLHRMESQGSIYRVKGQRYSLPEKINLKVGTLSIARSEDGFVIPDDGSQDVWIPSTLLDSAMNGDRVVARVEARGKGRNPEGRIIKVLSRAHPTVVGSYHSSRRLGYVSPMDQRISRDILIPEGEEGGAREGDMVVARISAYGSRKLNPVGRVDRVIGPVTSPGVDVLSILFGYGLDLEFPEEVEQAAQNIVGEKEKEGWGNRVDRTALHVFTIDPSDAKDHDDALSVEGKGGQLWEVGIHIADVSHFVERGSVLDLEAFRRGTSVYLVDRVVPMLPHVLSSDLCSLRPGVDRAALSLFVTLDASGQERGHRFERTRIRSRHRLDYEQVQSVLSGTEQVDPRTDGDLLTLAQLAGALRVRRFHRGSLDFDLPEARVILGPEGAPVDILKVVQLESHRLIEDLMLLANETVAREMGARRLPILYRVHEPPSPGRMEELRWTLKPLGYSLPKRGISTKDLQEVLKRSAGKPEANLVSTLILRSLARARYHQGNLGHFGLGAETYTHFTSPIRRYPDLLVHRVLVRALLNGERIPASWGGAELAEAAERSTLREQLAADAERDSVALKKAEFMERHLGEEFNGTVSGVKAFGVFVLLDEYFVEGLIHVNALTDDFYRLKEGEHVLIGERSGRRFRLGDPVRVRVSRVDRLERKIDFVPVPPGTPGRV